MRRRNQSEDVPKERQPTALFAADLHIRSDVPVCRTDDFISAMWRKVEFLQETYLKYNLSSPEGDICPLFIAGDIGHKSQWTNTDLANFIYAIEGIHVIPGQHDLPEHRLDKWTNGGLGVLFAARTVQIHPSAIRPFEDREVIYYLCPYGENVLIPEKEEGIRNVLIIHRLIEKEEAKKFLKDHPCYDLIVAGDNHEAFEIRYEGRLLVNCGSMMRSSADQEDHRPRIWAWYAETNTVEPIYYPIEQGVISREHIEKEESRMRRKSSFTIALQQGRNLIVSYRANLEKYLQHTRLTKGVVQKIWGAMGDK